MSPKKLIKEKETFEPEDFNPVSNSKDFKRLAPKILLGIGLLIIIALLVFKNILNIAVVNGKPISRLSFIAEMQKQSGSKILDNMITRALVLQEAKKQGVAVTTKEIDDDIKKIQDNFKSQGQDFNQLLTAQNMTMTDLRDQVNLQLIVQKINDKDIKVTDKEISDYTEKNKSSFPADAKPEDIKKQVNSQLLNQKLTEKIQKWLDDLKSKAKIQNFLK